MASHAVLKAALGAGVFLLSGLAAAAASDQRGFLAADPLFLAAPLKALKVASLDLPRPLGTGVVAPVVAARLDLPQPAEDPAPAAPVRNVMVEDEEPDMLPGSAFGPDLGGADAPALARAAPMDATADVMAPQEALTQFSPDGIAIYHDPVAVFGTDPDLFPPLAFEYPALADRGLVPQPLPRPPVSFALQANNVGEAHETPAEFLGLSGPRLAKAERCMAQAVYFESRGEPKRGQIAVAQVILNRVLSGYYPKDVCGTVYQNANRRLACQFTFACDRVKDVVREPDMWEQAEQIASDMLGGRLWLDSVGRATHYHAYWVHPRWVREMRKLDRIGVHTFYRPRRWEG